MIEDQGGNSTCLWSWKIEDLSPQNIYLLRRVHLEIRVANTSRTVYLCHSLGFPDNAVLSGVDTEETLFPNLAPQKAPFKTLFEGPDH